MIHRLAARPPLEDAAERDVERVLAALGAAVADVDGPDGRIDAGPERAAEDAPRVEMSPRDSQALPSSRLTPANAGNNARSPMRR